MNIQEYISSGIVESYVLGLADEAERAEFEQMCTQYAEVRAARDTFELSLEQHAMAAAVAPPAHIRETVLQQLAAGPEDVPAGKTAAPVVQMRLVKRGVLPGAMRYVAAASVVLLMGSMGLNVYYFNKYRSFSQRYDQLVAEQTQLAKNNGIMQTRLDNYEQTMQALNSPYMAQIKMEGKAVEASPAPDSKATVLWDTRTKDVYLMVNSLPEPQAGMQYQLWAIVDNQPVDAGMLNMEKGHMMVKMKNIPRAQLFAITLEQEGGSPTPKGKMYVMGKV
ncbi:MAG TPA: anti-sigma factor [Niastella sp.]